MDIEALQYQTQAVTLPLTVRSIFSSLPVSISLQLIVGERVARLPLAARQLVKLARVVHPMTLDGLRIDAERPDNVELQLLCGDREVILDDGALKKDIHTLMFFCLDRLLSRALRRQLTERLAFRSAVFGTLRRITRRMLASTDPDEALYCMLSGITSGYALGFNRAVFFLEEPDGSLRGHRAIGPADVEEAHRIWETLETEDHGIEDMIESYARRDFDTRFQNQIQGISLSPETRDALCVEGVEVFTEPPAADDPLSALDIQGAYVLASLEAHDRRLGVLFADHRYGASSLHEEKLAALSFFIDQTALILENLLLLRRVARQARIDPLTGVVNRRAWREHLEALSADLDATPRPCALILVDVDHFKQVNDLRGHAVGDEVLQRLAEILRTDARRDDLVGRFGGDELQMICVDLPQEALAGRVQHIGDAARRAGISISVGGACWPADCATLDGLFTVADRRLYVAKKNGRACACIDDDGAIIRFDGAPAA